jgi:hypothetical protein
MRIWVTMPKLPRLSSANPAVPLSQPYPPPSVSPTIPTSPMAPVAGARPCRWAATATSEALAPPPRIAVAVLASTVTLRINDMSMTTPPSVNARPAQSCPPARTAMGSAFFRA